uniref:Uncharacterized protein n=1 Tax=Panagrolaimus sp. ES5 TaxID=591445 RepID=A0AC34F149_9BILA
MLPKNGDEAIPSSSSKDIPSSSSASTTKKSVIDFEKCLNKIDVINWDDYIKNINWDSESDIEKEGDDDIEANIPSTSNNNSSSLNLNKSSQKRVENINDGIQPCSSKTPIWANHSCSNGIKNYNNEEEMPSTSAAGSSSGLKVGLEYRRHLPPQIRHKHPYVA